MFVGLVRDPSWGREPPEEPPCPGDPWPRPPWRPFAWFAAVCWLLWLAGVLGGLPGYLVVLLVVGVSCWRLDRWIGRQYWGGLTETQR